ncbi:MAG: NAD(P)/FAD-dependent oxidoreductase [Acidimicrobiia bacterium]
MSQLDFDAVIVGAGPAGTATAIHLTRLGFSVGLFDKAQFPRDKTCGDGLTTLALRELESLGFQPAVVPSWTTVTEAVLHSPYRHIVSLPLPRGPGVFAAVTRRMELDDALLQTAIETGVQFFPGASLTSASQDATAVKLGFSNLGEVSARWAIGADGMWSPLARMLGAAQSGYRGEWHAFRQYFTNTAPGSSNLHIWFEPDLLPGYVWSFPVGENGANVGFGVLRGERMKGAELARLWPELLKRPAILRVLGTHAEPEDTHRAWPIPAGVTAATPTWGRFLFVGDAVRAGDVLTGEGIGQALLSGRLAADAVGLTQGSSPTVDEVQTVALAYEKALQQTLFADARMASLLNKIIAAPWRAETAIRVIGLSLWNRQQFARWLFEDSPRGIAFMPSHWKRGALSGPAAFAPRN